MFPTSDKNRLIEFSKLFSERYTVEQTSEIVMSSMLIKTVTEMRWDVRLLEITENTYRIELLSIDNTLKETNNPNIRDLSAFNNAFKRMYSELDMVINRKGELIKINNITEIQRKWALVKAEMEEIQTKQPNMQGIVALNDEIFSSSINITKAVKANEFFEVFFNTYMGIKLPENKSLTKNSLFYQHSVKWNFEINYSHPSNSSFINITVKGQPHVQFDKEWIKKAYGNYPVDGLANKKPKVTDEGIYKLDQTSGRLLEGILTKEEIVDDDFLRAKMVYHIIADQPLPQSMAQKPAAPTEESTITHSWIL
nr:hypothetical protein [Pedobacter sp. ASV2]